MDKVNNQFLELFITTEKSSFSKSIYIRWYKESNIERGINLFQLDEGKQKHFSFLRPFIIIQLITITSIEYLKIILDANFGTKREVLLLFHLQ